MIALMISVGLLVEFKGNLVSPLIAVIIIALGLFGTLTAYVGSFEIDEKGHITVKTPNFEVSDLSYSLKSLLVFFIFSALIIIRDIIL